MKRSRRSYVRSSVATYAMDGFDTLVSYDTDDAHKGMYSSPYAGSFWLPIRAYELIEEINKRNNFYRKVRPVDFLATVYDYDTYQDLMNDLDPDTAEQYNWILGEVSKLSDSFVSSDMSEDYDDLYFSRNVRGKRVIASKRTSGRISHKRPVKASLDYDKFYDRMDAFHSDRINRAGYNFLRRMDYDQRLQILRAAKKEVGAWSVSLEALEAMAEYMVGNNSLDRVIDKVLTLGNYDAMVDSMIAVVECACVMAVDQSRDF